MDQREAFEIAEQYAKIVVDNVDDVNKVVLYGSCARGTMGKDSDIDIAVIVDSVDDDFIAANVHLYRLSKKVDLRIEPVLLVNEYDPSDFLPNVLKTGKVIYDITKHVH